MNRQKSIPERMDDFFNDRVDGYDDHMKGIDNSDEFYSAIPSPIASTIKPIKLLDLGCGTGLELKGIFEKAPNAHITCIDIATGMLDELKRKYSSRSNQLSIIVGSYLDVSFSGNEFDYVLAVQTMHHWQKDVKVKLYRKIWKSLKPEGLYIEADYVVDAQEEKERLNKYISLQKSGALTEGEIYHIDIPFSAETQRRLLGTAGFSRIDVIYEKGTGGIFVARK